ncbi:MAG: efflux RND transporter periplasmic adaptor subunit [Chitinophagaceae bacterium]|nr:efflux RND transporter periplasmic adaptor subunit [Chitinophagaceae bacterium]MBK8953659.1 efflux RND transporter periplasmic adaptor subunit [Chitinophagaceae bacterium]
MRIIAILFLLSVLFVSCNSKKKKVSGGTPQTGQQRNQTLRVDGYIIRPETFQESFEVPGTIVANEVSEIHPEVSGRLVQLNVLEGKYVSKGAVLAKIYDGDLQAQLRKVQVQLELAQKTEERQSQLLKIQGISQQDYDISLLQVNNLKADIGILQTSIAKTIVRAPFSGKIGLNKISPGAYVTPASVIAIINQTDQLKLDFSIPEKYTGKITIGQLVTFTISGSKKQLGAKVVATEANITENTRSLTVRAAVMAKDEALIAGAFAKVQLSFDPDPSAILVPTQAILPQARGKKIILYKEGKAVFQDVITGIRDSARVQITEGLQPGDTIIVTGLLSVRPEAKIQIGKIVNGEGKR